MRLKKRIELLDQEIDGLTKLAIDAIVDLEKNDKRLGRIQTEVKKLTLKVSDPPIRMAEQRRLTLLKRNALITQGKDGA